MKNLFIRIKFTFLSLLLIGIIPVQAKDDSKGLQNFYEVKLVSVYDGDTFKVNLPCKYDIFCKNIAVRIKGIDSPEIRTKDPCEKRMAKKARSFSKKFLRSGTIVLRNCQRDKYFRLLCDVFVLEGKSPSKKVEKSLQEAILAKNLAGRYDGGTKNSINWCDFR